MYNEFDAANDETIAFVAHAIEDRRVFMNIQGIHRADTVDDILYGECLARVADCSGRIYAAGEFMPTLELLGAAPMLDRCMLMLVLDQLERDPRTHLGCNISADNFETAQVWNSLVEILLRRPQLLPQLFVEITETRPLGDLKFASNSIKYLRELGCKVTIDDFGSGFLPPLTLASLDVDIVKIDAGFVWQGRKSSRARDALAHLIAYAKSFVSTVIVEGVENDTDLALALAAGATHVQGYYLSRPILFGHSAPIKQ